MHYPTTDWINDAPSGKIGAKFLDENQLQNTFPNWKSLLARINEQRAISKYAQENQLDMPYEYTPQMYDNIYAILGGRGSGKSSVLLTIRKYIQEHNPQDIVLPIVTPESIGAGSILGWLMSLVEQEIATLEKKIEKLHRTNSLSGAVELDGFFDDCRFKRKNPLRREYEELCLLIADVCDGERSGTYATGEAAYQRVDRSRKQFRLIRELNLFWKSLADTATIVRRYDRTGSAHQTDDVPMIVISFDDIDLAPERSMELLTTTFQYLTASNIVIILSAAEKVLQKVINIRMLERILASDSTSVLTDFPFISKRHSKAVYTVDDMNRTMEEFYTKVIPPARRFYLRTFKTVRDKRSYFYSSTRQCFHTNDSNHGHAIPIDILLTGQIEKLIDKLNANGSYVGTRSNFLRLGERGAFNDAYLLIFGEKNREIVNGCLAIINAVSQLCKTIEKSEPLWSINPINREDVLAVLRQLLTTLFQAKQETSHLNRDYVAKLIYADVETGAIQIDYSVILARYRSQINNVVSDSYSFFFEQKNEKNDFDSDVEKLKSAKRDAACIMMMLFFVENILILMEPKNRPLRGSRELGIIINSASLAKQRSNPNNDQYDEALCVFPLHFDVNECIVRSPALLEHIDLYVNANLHDSDQVYDLLFDAVGGYHNIDAAIQALNRAMIWDRDWVKTVLMLLDLYGSDITLCGKSMVKISQKAQNTLEHFAFGGDFIWALTMEALDYMDMLDLENYSEGLVSEFIQEMNKEIRGVKLPSILMNSTLVKIDDDITLGNRFQVLEDIEWSDRNADKLQKYYLRLASVFWKTMNEDSLLHQPDNQQLVWISYQIQRFFTNYLDGILMDIMSNTKLFISETDAETILQIMSRIGTYHPDLKHSKNNMQNQLNRLIQLKQQSPSSGTEGKHKINPIAFVQYLDDLNNLLKKTAEDNTGQAFDISVEKDYASLEGYLILIDASEDMAQGTYPFPKSLPPTSRIAITVNMLRSLFKYYLAACILIAKDKRLGDNRCDNANPAHDYLLKLFETLKTAGTPVKSLEMLMVKAHAELVRRTVRLWRDE